MPKITLYLFVVLFPLLVSAQDNRVVVLVEGYDRFPRVGATITLGKGPGINIICDPGMIKDTQLLVDALAREGVSPDDITHVFLTHQHTDHIANLGLFAHARIVDAYGIYEGDHWGGVNAGEVNFGPGIRGLARKMHQ